MIPEKVALSDRRGLADQEPVLGRDGLGNGLRPDLVAVLWRRIARRRSMASAASTQPVIGPASEVVASWQQGNTATRARTSSARSSTKSVRLPQAWLDTIRSALVERERIEWAPMSSARGPRVSATPMRVTHAASRRIDRRRWIHDVSVRGRIVHDSEHRPARAGHGRRRRPRRGRRGTGAVPAGPLPTLR